MMEKNSALNKEDKSRRMSKTNPEKELDASMEKHSSMSTAGYWKNMLRMIAFRVREKKITRKYILRWENSQ